MIERTFELGQPVIYRGKTYTFPGHVCGITDDGQYIVRAIGAPDGSYAGMKHIYGASQLEPLSTHSEGKDKEGEWRSMKDAPTDRALLLDISYWYPGDLAPTECFVIGQAISGGRWDCEDGVRTIDQINGWRPIPKTSIRSTETGGVDAG